MQLKTILNRVAKQPGFVFGKCRFEGNSLRVRLVPRARARARCGGCGKRRPTYDTRPSRYFQFLPLFTLTVFFLYAPRRVSCGRCGVVVEMMPWADGKRGATTMFLWFLASWAKVLSWRETARRFGTSAQTVFRAVEMAVVWGRAHVSLDGIKSIGVDEIAWSKGQRYFTVVYQIDHHRKRLLWLAEKRTKAAFRGFFDWLGEKRSARLEFVASDMWRAFLEVVKERAPNCSHVLDRFHVMQMCTKAVDSVRRAEARELRRAGQPALLNRARYVLLKNRENLNEEQSARLTDLLRANLTSTKAYLLKEELRAVWRYVSPHWAGRRLDEWTSLALRTRHPQLDPVRNVARSLRRHRPLILNWFEARRRRAFALGATEGLNNKAKLSSKMGFGFRTLRQAEIALFHRIGDLPVPPHVAHWFRH